MAKIIKQAAAPINRYLSLESKIEYGPDSEQDSLKNIVAEAEREKIMYLLAKNKGNVSQVARDLGVTRRTIHYKIKKYGIKN